LALLFLHNPANYLHATEAEKTQTQDELKRVVEKLSAIENWFSSALKKRRDWQNEIKDTDLEISRVTNTILQLSTSLESAEQSLHALEKKHQQLSLLQREQGKLIIDHLSAAQRLSGQDFFKLLLNQESPDTFDRMIRYHSYFTGARSNISEQFLATLKEMEQTELTIAERQDQLQVQHKQQEQEKARLEHHRRERSKLLSGLSRQEQQKSAERNSLREDEQRITALLNSLVKKTRSLDGTSFQKAKGKLPWPMQGRIAHAFGRPREGGRLKWQGLVIRADQDTPIYAVHDGRVVFSNWLRGFGLLTIIDHGNGYMSVYAHADSLYKREGEHVDGGESIASAGKSGGQKHSGMYFEIRATGQPEDPIKWLSPR
ncbi:MAG: peptidoglycan DD-metalloendopeptidase family protein, partial [Pseudomonadales bacterium]|nr:peptidoglycan DD-metalloendopeptidase family protein [Pseudomonadales bacterium]